MAAPSTAGLVVRVLCFLVFVGGMNEVAVRVRRNREQVEGSRPACARVAPSPAGSYECERMMHGWPCRAAPSTPPGRFLRRRVGRDPAAGCPPACRRAPTRSPPSALRQPVRPTRATATPAPARAGDASHARDGFQRLRESHPAIPWRAPRSSRSRLPPRRRERAVALVTPVAAGPVGDPPRRRWPLCSAWPGCASEASPRPRAPARALRSTPAGGDDGLEAHAGLAEASSAICLQAPSVADCADAFTELPALLRGGPPRRAGTTCASARSRSAERIVDGDAPKVYAATDEASLGHAVLGGPRGGTHADPEAARKIREAAAEPRRTFGLVGTEPVLPPTIGLSCRSPERTASSVSGLSEARSSPPPRSPPRREPRSPRARLGLPSRARRRRPSTSSCARGRWR